MGRAARAADAPPSDNGGAPGATPDDSSNMAPVPPSASEQAQQNLQNFSQQALDDISSELDKIDPFLKTMEDQIFDMQLLTALKDKRDELRRELRRIFSLARKGLIQPELVDKIRQPSLLEIGAGLGGHGQGANQRTGIYL